MDEPEDSPTVETVVSLERRQDEVLRELELLDSRLAALLVEYVALAAPSRIAA
jgi:hypothetical protein